MTFTIGHVDGGTHGGWRKTKPKPNRWFCNCETGDGMKLNHGYLVRCLDCKTERSG